MNKSSLDLDTMAVNDNDGNDQTLKGTQLKKKTVESIVSSIGIILKMFD